MSFGILKGDHVESTRWKCANAAFGGLTCIGVVVSTSKSVWDAIGSRVLPGGTGVPTTIWNDDELEDRPMPDDVVSTISKIPLPEVF